MEFSQLRIFQAVAQEGSITRAAERLHRVPSNLSTRLKQLEEQMGVELFVRERQRLQLSPAGQVLLDYTARLFALHDEALSAVQGGVPSGKFTLGTMYSTASIWLTSFTRTVTRPRIFRCAIPRRFWKPPAKRKIP